MKRLWYLLSVLLMSLGCLFPQVEVQAELSPDEWEALQPEWDYDPSIMYTLDELARMYDSVVHLVSEENQDQSQGVNSKEVIAKLGEPSDYADYGRSEALYYVAIEEEEVGTLRLQTFDHGHGRYVVEVVYQLRDQAMFHPLKIEEKELKTLEDQQASLSDYQEVLGPPFQTSFYPLDQEKSETIYEWLGVPAEGGEDDLIAVHLVVDEADQVLRLDYALREDLPEEEVEEVAEEEEWE